MITRVNQQFRKRHRAPTVPMILLASLGPDLRRFQRSMIGARYTVAGPSGSNHDLQIKRTTAGRPPVSVQCCVLGKTQLSRLIRPPHSVRDRLLGVSVSVSEIRSLRGPNTHGPVRGQRRRGRRIHPLGIPPLK
jgi:hypothetical protein